MSVTIYHNPRCSKSRQTLALISDKADGLTVREYLKDAPTRDDIKDLVKMLGISSARDMMRRGERIYKELGLKDVDSEDSLINAMVENPILVERPIVIRGDKAVIGRPPENVLALFS